ncbi:MAG: hypothetical protein QNK37_09995 [Acidobacteriota bacterium]|nr:hypothetical protein [Acidobacteriota bacterium]
MARYLWFLFPIAFLVADEPLPPPATHTVFSGDRGFCAVSDVDKQVTTVHRVKDDQSPGEVLWQIPGWHRALYLSKDGRHLVIGYSGYNLIPLDYRKDMIMLTFYAEGAGVREIPLNRLIFNFGKLKRTVSHYEWGSLVGFDSQGRFRVETVEGRTMLFDPATGKRVDR